MRATVSIVFDSRTEVLMHVPAGAPPWTLEQARRWLDEQFNAYECEPVRASGKVLTADKLLALAAAIGASGFQADPALRDAYAQAAAAALERDVVRVDVGASTVSS
ncbi:MAG: hypothetical protein U1E89_17920 [Burkholderiaceae bacterium]